MEKEERRDYRGEDYRKEDDPRFKTALKEGIFTQVLCLSAIGLELLAAYGLCPKDPARMTYIAGLPVWFFVSSLVAVLAFIIVMIYVAKYSKDISFEARESKERSDE